MQGDPPTPEIRLRGKSEAAFLDIRGAERTSLFLKHGRKMEFLRRGMTFERPRAYRSVETARILCLMLDEQGVPHVRYAVALRRGGQTELDDEELRTLSLKAFADQYCEVDASARFACVAPRWPGALGRALRGGLRRLLPAAAHRASSATAHAEAAPQKPARGGGHVSPSLNSA